METRELLDLKSLIDGGNRFDIDHAVRIVLGCCRAEDRAQPRGVISPTRILIASDGGVTLGTDVTMKEHVGYHAPEIGSAAPPKPAAVFVDDKGNRSFLILPPERDFDRDRSSVFSLGVVLWELLAGRRLFKGTNDYETLILPRKANVPPLDGVPPALEAIVRKALAKDLEARYQTVIELGDALEGLRAR